ncbi:MAG TPA: Coq4 family protein [Myxococcota bacterium]|jgi:ubiquinone biosynthesis protein COQ4|nr:Coq4 family protein [Myxococcota bacterium]
MVAFPLDAPGFDVPPPLPRKRLDARRALRTLSELIAQPTRTEKVFELFDAVGGDDGESSFQRFLSDPEGRRLFGARSSLRARLGDRAGLAKLRAGSLGRAYLAHLDRYGLDPTGVLDAQERARKPGDPDTDPGRAWFFERVNLMHDLWHALTGYGADEAGEAALLAFTQAQLPTRGIGLLIAAAAWLGPWGDAFAWQRYLVRAWRRGRRARLLVAADWEALLARPISEVRAALGIEAPEVAHPGGVIEAHLFGGRYTMARS